jgi:hypothetical protein
LSGFEADGEDRPHRVNCEHLHIGERPRLQVSALALGIRRMHATELDNEFGPLAAHDRAISTVTEYRAH